MRRMKQSFGHAVRGTRQAIARERNLQLFIAGYVCVVLAGSLVGLLTWEWLALIGGGGLFMVAELLNTALERLTDAFDENRKIEGGRGYHAGLRATKDIAAGASLMSLICMTIITCLVFFPYARLMVQVSI